MENVDKAVLTSQPQCLLSVNDMKIKEVDAETETDISRELVNNQSAPFMLSKSRAVEWQGSAETMGLPQIMAVSVIKDEWEMLSGQIPVKQESDGSYLSELSRFYIKPELDTHSNILKKQEVEHMIKDECKWKSEPKQISDGMTNSDGSTLTITDVRTLPTPIIPDNDTGVNEYSAQPTAALTTSSHLTQNMQNHLVDKPYSCTVCSKSFTSSSNLKHHMRIHTGDKPYSCTVCSKSFTRSGNLKQHMQRHTGD
jgi:hypothetical protein